jgi:hypothetical protein
MCQDSAKNSSFTLRCSLHALELSLQHYSSLFQGTHSRVVRQATQHQSAGDVQGLSALEEKSVRPIAPLNAWQRKQSTNKTNDACSRSLQLLK